MTNLVPLFISHENQLYPYDSSRIHRKPIDELVQHHSIIDLHHFNATLDNTNFNNKTIGIEYAQDFRAIIVPRSRRAWPLLAQWLMQVIVCFMVAHIWKL